MDTFDYIVTGAGSAGCVAAARLSEGGRYRVLLLEAGGSDGKLDRPDIQFTCCALSRRPGKTQRRLSVSEPAGGVGSQHLLAWGTAQDYNQPLTF